MDIPKADDRMALGVAAAMAKTTTTQPLPDISNLAPTYGESMDMARAMDSAQRSMRSMDVNPAEFDPGTMATFAAYFRSENTVGSALNSKSLGETLFPTPASPEMSTDAVLNKVKEDNLSEYLHVFQDVENVAQYAARKADLLREIEDKRITSASSFFGAGGAAMLASGILDLPSLLPGSIGVKLGAKGVGTARAAGGVAAGAILGSTVTEFGLHASQVDRTFEESVSSVGGSIILGGALGAGLHQWARRSLNNRVVDAIEERLEKQVDDIAAGSPGAKSAGAAHVDAYEQMRARGIDENKPLTSYGMNESLNALGKIKGFVGANFRIPMLDIQNAQSPAVHVARDMLIFSPSIREGDVLGNVVSGPTVIGLVRDLREDFAGVADVAIKQYKGAKAAFKSYDEFDGLVTRALLDPNASVHPAVRATAKAHREVYTKVLDSLIENKVLPPEVKTKYGDTYVPLMFDGGAIQARASEFTDMIAGGFRRTLQEEAETALREHALRVQKNVDAKEKIVGVSENVPAVDASGQPVINPKTGKQRIEKRIVKEGQQFERDRITREQYDLWTSRVKEDRAGALEIFDTATNDALTKVGKVYDEYGQRLAQESATLLERTIRGTESTAQRATIAKRINAELKRSLDASEAERRAQLEAIRSQRRTEKKKLSEQYDTELSAAKQIKDENLGHSKETAQADLKAATVNIREGIEGPLRLTRDGKVDARKISDEAGALAKSWYDKTTGWNKTTLEHEIPGFADMLKKRRTPVSHIDLLNAGFVRGQSMSMLEDYVRMAGTDSATAAVFKRKAKPFGPDGKPMKEADLIDVGDLKMTSAFDDIKADYDSMRNAIFSSPAFEKKLAGIEKKYEKLLEGADDTKKTELRTQAQEEVRAAKAEVETKLADERERQIANLQHIHDSIRGTNSGGWSQSSLKAAELASGLNTLRLMGGQVISSLTDPIKIAVANGMGNMLKGAVTAWHQTAVPLWNKANAADKGLTRAGAAFMELNLNARIAAMADVNSPLRTDDKSVMWMRKTLDVFSSANGIRFWNGYWKQVSDNATSAWLGQMAYKGWDNLANSERARLGSLRINKDGLDIIKASHEVQTGGRFYDDWPLLDHENWTDKEASRLVRHALGEEIQNSVVTPQAQDRMMFATTPAGRLIWQFRQHMVSNQMRFMGRQLQLASLDNHNAAALGVGLVGLVAAGALVDFMKQLTGQISPTGYVDRNRSPIERHLDEWTKTPGMALYNALDRSDTLGIFIEGSNIADKLGLMGPKSLMQKPFDDPAHLKEVARFKDRHWADAVGGPTVGLLADAASATRTIGKIATGQKINRGDYRSAERLVPGQNIPYIQAATNAFEKYVGDKYAWPNPK